MKQIESTANPLIKQIVRLKERRERKKSGLFLIEGYREITRAIEGSVVIEKLFVAPELFLGSNEQGLMSKVQGEIINVPKNLFSKISYRDRPDGLLAIAKQMHLGLDALPKKKPEFFLLAESIEKPGNLGSILRSCDGAGVQGCIVCDRCTDIYNPNVVRSSVGTLFTLPTIETSSEEAYQLLKNRGVQILAATPHANQNYTQVDLSGPLAIAVGSEQLGLSDFWMEKADLQVKIPMMGKADSLNVAAATTILLYEALRQRQV